MSAHDARSLAIYYATLAAYYRAATPQEIDSYHRFIETGKPNQPSGLGRRG